MTIEVPTDLRHVPLPDVLPVLPLRDTVVYPMALVPLLVGQERSLRLVDDAQRGTPLIALVAQRVAQARPAGPEDLYRIGTAAVIRQLVRSEDGTVRLVVQGLERIRILEFVQTVPYLTARIERIPEVESYGLETEALTRTARDLFQKFVQISPEIPDELANAVRAQSEPRAIAYLIATSLPLSTAARQEILEINTVNEKLRRLVEHLQHEIQVRELEQKITAETREQMSKAQREYLLRERLKAIRRELGEEEEPERSELKELQERLDKTPLSPEARKEAERELHRLERTPAASPEHGMIRTYLDWLLSLPWGKTTGSPIDVSRARTVLDEDHYDLDKIKDRIVEYLAVKKLRSERQVKISLSGSGDADHAALAGPLPQTPADEALREPILCFVGPPGVGKTSLGQSIARAMGRTFVRISLGGIHDESEIRGHRRTYVGAMPGRIIQGLRRAETADPVFMLDEIDKLGTGFHGDPSAALLEVLDPAQNNTFVDNYLGVPFDLSKVLFICTANTTDTIPPPLLDRMEVLTIAGYTEHEKLFIARRYLLPKQIRAHGLLESEITIEDEALSRIIHEYTREAGVRNLEREIATIIRKAARRIAEGTTPPLQISSRQIPEYLGRPRYYNEVAERMDRPGVATGLAWTPTGGDVLFVETTLVPSSREELVLTGMLGNVMRESAQAALSYLRSNAARLGIDPKLFEGKTVHIHVPAGAIPKDGPSAGVTIVAALASLATGRPVRNDVAMTGEITLRGKVLPVGGIKEKVLAAYRAGVKTVILPLHNADAVEEDIPDEIRRTMQFVFVDTLDEVLSFVLSTPPRPDTRAIAVGEQPPAGPALHRP